MLAYILAFCAILVLAVTSLFVGVSDVSLPALISGELDRQAVTVLLVSRIPRTLALILAGSAVGVAGMIMQMLTRNRFVEASTVGTSESALLGLLVITLFAPGAPIFAKMGVASVFALGGTALFVALLQRVPLRSVLLVPLVGIMLSGVIGSVTTFFAYRLELTQSLGAWTTGDFSGVLSGRYELLWVAAICTLIAYIAADRFSVAGMGEEFSANLGLNFRAVMATGMVIISLVTSVVVVSVGAIPFLGLVVPNLVSMMVGDNMRRSVPWIALGGAGFVLVCDLIGRTIRFPYEIPIGTVIGVVGAALFIYLLLRRRHAIG